MTAESNALRLMYKRGHLSVRKRGHADGMVCDRCGRTAESGANGKMFGELLTRDCGRPSGVSCDWRCM